MAKPWRHPDTKVFYLYRQVPEAVRPVIGRRFWKASLRTRDPVEAARRFTVANAELEHRFAAAREELSQQALYDDITPEQAASVVDAYLRTRSTPKSVRWPSLGDTWWLEEAADRLLGPLPAGGLPEVDETGRIDPESLIDGRITGEAWLEVSGERPVSEWLQACGTVLAGLADSVVPALTRNAANDAELMKAWNARVAADIACVRAEAVGRPRTASRLRPNLKMRELLTAWAAAQTPRPQTLHETSQAVDDFIDLFGDVPVRTITSDMIYDYRDEARKLPKSMPRADRELRFVERLAKHAGSTTEKVSPATVKKRIGAIQALLSFAHGERWVAENAGLRIKITGYSRTGKARRSSRDGELTALFATPMFVDPASWAENNTSVSRPTLYWVFLLGLTTGARLEEVGQARLADVQKDAGVLFIDVDDRELEPASTESRGDKSIKNEGSRRVLPVHERLLRLGFERFCDGLRQAGHTMLFPDLSIGQFGKRTKEASRIANRYIDRHVSADRRLVFHSLRHKFKDEGRDAGVQERVLDQIAGHAPATVGARYGDGAGIPTLKRELDRLTFAAVDWAALEEAVVGLDWDVVAAGYVTSESEDHSA